jgi:hypothetical protein
MRITETFLNQLTDFLSLEEKDLILRYLAKDLPVVVAELYWNNQMERISREIERL